MIHKLSSIILSISLSFLVFAVAFNLYLKSSEQKQLLFIFQNLNEIHDELKLIFKFPI